MRINSHAHIFNLQTILTHEAVAIIAQRIRDRHLPEFVVKGVQRLLDELVDRPEYLSEEDLLGRLVDAITSTDEFKTFVGANIAALPVDVRIIGDGPKALGVQGLRSFLDKLSTFLGTTGAGTSSVFDVYETLRIALESSIAQVADHLLAHMDPEDAIVALMLDITSPTDPDQDRENFSKQIKGTAAAALQRPGRILPFIAVNSRREDHFERMVDALETRGFMGVKLYPSLGYEMDTEPMHRVFDYCQANDVPIVMHCTTGGFYATQSAQQFCNPAVWEPLLADRPALRICFAHCGGEAGLEGAGGAVAPGSWTAEIVSLMNRFSNVVMDVAYHNGMMENADTEARYFATLKSLINNAAYRGRILWGTDSWLLRLSVADDTYWAYFMEKLTPAEFQQIAEDAPKAFLGLPDANGIGARANIQRFIDFVGRNRDRLGAPPTSWLAAALGGQFTVTGMSPDWTTSNLAHFYTYQFAMSIMAPADIEVGFTKAGEFPLSRLQYWGGGPSSTGFTTRCEGTALVLIKFMKKTDAVYEAAHTDKTAFDALSAAFANGDRMLSELGAVVDALFRFDSETQLP